jgi:Acyltransferase family
MNVRFIRPKTLIVGLLRKYVSNISHSIRAPLETSRDFHADAMKGVAIFLVVLGHTIGTTVQYPWLNLWYQIIFSFVMPLWMFLSG